MEFGCDINYADNDGWTPLHCAASCNNTPMVQFLVEHGACIYATTTRDNETAAEKCEEEEENYTACSQYLLCRFTAFYHRQIDILFQYCCRRDQTVPFSSQ